MEDLQMQALNQYFRGQAEAGEDVKPDTSKAQRRLTNQEMTVKIPAMDNHGDYMVNTVTVRLLRYCPQCGAERSIPWQALSYDGSRRLEVDTWNDGCNHYSGYAGHRKEAQMNGLNRGYTGQAGYDVRNVEVVADVIEIGDYVRIVEDADTGNNYSLTYIRDRQLVGVVKDRRDNGYLSVLFRFGMYPMRIEEVYLVDVSALHGEMEEMIAEAAEQSESTPKMDSAPADDATRLYSEYESYRHGAWNGGGTALGYTEWLEEKVLSAWVNVGIAREERDANSKSAVTAQTRVIVLEERVKLLEASAKTYHQALDTIHAILTNNGDDREFTPDELRIFDIAEDTLMGITGAANADSEQA